MNMTKLIIAMGLMGLASAAQVAVAQTQQGQAKKPAAEQVTGFGKSLDRF